MAIRQEILPKVSDFGKELIQSEDAAVANTLLGGGATPTAPAWSDITGKPDTFAPTVGTSATTAMAGNTPVLKPGAITAIAALTSTSTLEEVIAALQHA